MWRGHHFPGHREPERSNRVRKRTLGTPFWTFKINGAIKADTGFLGPEMGVKHAGRRTHTHDFLEALQKHKF